MLFIDQFDDWLKINDRISSEFEIELDGFSGKCNGVFLITTSQKKPSLSGDDEFGGSLFRRGRIGIHIGFVKPDRKQQTELLQGFLSEHTTEKVIDHKNIIYLLSGTTPAELKYMVSEARLTAERENEGVIAQNHLVRAFLSSVLDPPSGHEASEEDKEETRIHELGHYIVARAWGIPARLVCVINGISSFGQVRINDSFRTTNDKNMLNDIALTWGSIEAERMFGFLPNDGRGSDVEQINTTAGDFLRLGERSGKLKRYSLLLPLRDDRDQITISEEMSSAYEKELAKVMSRGQKQARKTLKFFGKKLIKRVSDVLAKNPTGVMLQSELDPLLEPKLSQFHKKHKVKDQIND